MSWRLDDEALERLSDALGDVSSAFDAMHHNESVESIERAYRASIDLSELLMLTLEAASQIVVECSCGGQFTRAEWQALGVVGRMDDGVEEFELRNCTACGSTRARRLGPSRKFLSGLGLAFTTPDMGGSL